MGKQQKRNPEYFGKIGIREVVTARAEHSRLHLGAPLGVLSKDAPFLLQKLHQDENLEADKQTNPKAEARWLCKGTGWKSVYAEPVRSHLPPPLDPDLFSGETTWDAYSSGMAGRISKRGELKGVGFGEGLHHPKMMESKAEYWWIIFWRNLQALERKNLAITTSGYSLSDLGTKKKDPAATNA